MRYEFTQIDKRNSKTANLEFFINEESTPFRGNIAIVFKKLLDEPYRKFVTEEVDTKKRGRPSKAAEKRAYDRVSNNKVKEVNRRILNDFPSYGISYFIVMDGYIVQVNPNYIHLLPRTYLSR